MQSLSLASDLMHAGPAAEPDLMLVVCTSDRSVCTQKIHYSKHTMPPILQHVTYTYQTQVAALH